jgi:hypothetical protein
MTRICPQLGEVFDTDPDMGPTPAADQPYGPENMMYGPAAPTSLQQFQSALYELAHPTPSAPTIGIRRAVASGPPSVALLLGAAAVLLLISRRR